MKISQQRQELSRNILLAEEVAAEYIIADYAELGDGAPTLHKVYQCFCIIERSIKFSPLDSTIVHYLKKQGTLCLPKKFLINDINLLALFFNPKFKSLTPAEKSLTSLSCTTVN